MKTRRDHFAASQAPVHRAKMTSFVVVLAIGLSALTSYGQTLMSDFKPEGTMRLQPSDVAVLERQEARRDLPCAVSRLKTELYWDFTFHTGFQVDVPVTELVGRANELTVLFRVVPQDRPDEPVYMTQRVHVPAIEEGSKGVKTFYGSFMLGEGKYHVDWLMRDQGARFCATFWDLETKLDSKDSQVREWIPKNLIQPVGEVFAEETPIPRTAGSALRHVSIIVSFDPPNPSSARLDDRDIESLVAMLRQIGRDPRIETYSIVACSLEAQQILYRQENTTRIDLRALGEALPTLKLGMIDAKQLASGNAPGQFATALIREHLNKEKPDALVVLGRKPGWGHGVSREALDSLGNPDTPAFYLSYAGEIHPGLSPSRDLISSIMKRLRGLEYQISQPKDLFNAWSKVISQIARTKQGGQAAMREQTN